MCNLYEFIDFSSSEAEIEFVGKYFQDICGLGFPSASQFNKLLEYCQKRKELL